MEETLRYNYRLRPGAVATRRLSDEWDRCRWVWNQSVGLLQEKEEWVSGQNLTGWRRERDWISDGSVVPQQQTLRNFTKKRAEGKGRKKFKSRKTSRASMEYTKRGFSIKDGRLRLAKCPPIPVVWSRELPSEPSSVQVYCDSLGNWYASFVVKAPVKALPDSPNQIGIDWGVKEIATTTDNAYDLPHPEFGKRSSQKLAHYQRMMARRHRPGQVSSKGYKQAKRQAAKVHKKVACQRKDVANKWARKVTNNFGSIAVEDFKPTFLAKSTMAKKASDGSIGATKHTLLEYASRAGREVSLVNPAYTTMTCSSCLARAKRRLELSERTFLCEFCGFTDTRDKNAARVILDRAGFHPDSADVVRQLTPSGVTAN